MTSLFPVAEPVEASHSASSPPVVFFPSGFDGRFGDGAVKVQVVEKVVIEVRERRIEVTHSRSDCINAVLADDDLWSQ